MCFCPHNNELFNGCFILTGSLSVREARVNMRREADFRSLKNIKKNEGCDYADRIVGNKTILFAAIIRQA